MTDFLGNNNLVNASNIQTLRQNWLESPYNQIQARAYLESVKNLAPTDFTSKLDDFINSIGDFSEKKWLDDNFLIVLINLSYELINLNDYELALIFLNDLYKANSQNLFVNYELGFVNLLLGNYQTALDFFEAVIIHENTFDTLLNIVMCKIYLTRLEKLDDYFVKLKLSAQSSEEEIEVFNTGKIIYRLNEIISAKNIKTYREWLYILYGSILINDRNNLLDSQESGKTTNKSELTQILTDIYILKRFLESLNINIEIITYLEPDSFTLSHLFGLVFELPVELLTNQYNNAKCLIIVNDTQCLRTNYKTFTKTNRNIIFYCYELSNDISLPITPAIVNKITFDSVIPYSTITNDGKEYQEIMQKAFDTLPSIETDCNTANHIASLTQFYELKQANLLLDNTDTFKDYFQYHAELKYLVKDR